MQTPIKSDDLDALEGQLVDLIARVRHFRKLTTSFPNGSPTAPDHRDHVVFRDTRKQWRLVRDLGTKIFSRRQKGN